MDQRFVIVRVVFSLPPGFGGVIARVVIDQLPTERVSFCGKIVRGLELENSDSIILQGHLSTLTPVHSESVRTQISPINYSHSRFSYYFNLLVYFSRIAYPRKG